MGTDDITERGFQVKPNKPLPLSGWAQRSLCNAEIQSPACLLWGRYCISAGITELKRRYAEMPIHLVGHSAGGALVGLAPNCSALERIVMVGCTSGHLVNIAGYHRFVARLFLKLYCPFCNFVFGYVPAKWLGFGEDLPAGVAAQWSSWCSRPGYVVNAFSEKNTDQFYGRLRADILWISASDDPYATPKNVEELLHIFPNKNAQRIVLEPDDYELKKIGHAGFFRRQSEQLWPFVLNWLRSGKLH